MLCFAPTRSGKGVGLVVPSLLTWPGSSIVHDIMGENWQLTAGFRARHGRVLLFDPTNPKSAAYNPLIEVRRGEWEVRDVQNIADILVDPEGSLDKRNHWEKTSHSLLVGAILHVLYAESDKTLAGVANFLSDPKRPVEATLRAMMNTPHLGEAGVHPVIASSARELLNKSENERSGVLSTAMSFLGLYRDPVVARVTARFGLTPQTLVVVGSLGGGGPQSDRSGKEEDMSTGKIGAVVDGVRLGGDLSPERLLHAYRHGIFPWYSAGQPILWWSPDPRMVLFTDELRVSRSLRRRVHAGSFELRIDTAFADVMTACAGTPRE